MRVAIITESYAPDVNGVANSVVRVAQHLVARGHEPLVIAPRPRRHKTSAPADYPVLRLPSLPMPGYPNVRLALPSKRIREALLEYQPDIVHLASPFVLGAWGSTAAAELGLPMVAVYQTDVPGYAAVYGIGLTERLAWNWIAKLHGRATMTLAPSTATASQLREHAVTGISHWGRGVDPTLFHPRRRNAALRAELAPNGEVVVGYVGRLAKEKRVDDLCEAARLPGVRVVVVGDGPTRAKVARSLPGATFLGTRGGRDLARIYASLDVFVHTGPHETFCQTVQEAMASGVPVIAPAAGGPLDLIRPGETGLLVPPGEPAALAHAVSTLADDRELRERMGIAARVAVADRSWATLGDELIGHYRAVLGIPAPTAMELVP